MSQSAAGTFLSTTAWQYAGITLKERQSVSRSSRQLSWEHRRCLHPIGADLDSQALWGETDGMRLLQPKQETASGGPSSSPPALRAVLPWKQTLHSAPQGGQKTMAMTENMTYREICSLWEQPSSADCPERFCSLQSLKTDPLKPQAAWPDLRAAPAVSSRSLPTWRSQ